MDSIGIGLTEVLEIARAGQEHRVGHIDRKLVQVAVHHSAQHRQVEIASAVRIAAFAHARR